MDQKIKNEIIRLVADRVPNPVFGVIIARRLKQYDVHKVYQAIEELVAEHKLRKLPAPAERARSFTTEDFAYELPSDANIPVRRFIRIGDTEVPRVLTSDVAAASLEGINEAIETLSEYSATLEKRFQSLIEKERREYWANLITLFGIFIAIFSFIIVALPRIEVSPSSCFWQVVALNTAQVLPVAFVLVLFVLLLVLLFRKLG
jgi:hypothetical protein